jgi:hypothetical protein
MRNIKFLKHAAVGLEEYEKLTRFALLYSSSVSCLLSECKK